MQVLLGIATPSAKVPVVDLNFFDSSLNASQREAVQFSLESPEVACIHGPPGGVSFLRVTSVASNKSQGPARHIPS